ncbi:MAG TPA: hypothetical protein VH684_03135 [Xanthobacteraceae bacterium]|jgi:hypothetical protein
MLHSHPDHDPVRSAHVALQLFGERVGLKVGGGRHPEALHQGQYPKSTFE